MLVRVRGIGLLGGQMKLSFFSLCTYSFRWTTNHLKRKSKKLLLVPRSYFLPCFDQVERLSDWPRSPFTSAIPGSKEEAERRQGAQLGAGMHVLGALIATTPGMHDELCFNAIWLERKPKSIDMLLIHSDSGCKVEPVQSPKSFCTFSQAW